MARMVTGLADTKHRHHNPTLMGCRRDALDALFALLEAVLTAATIETPAYLSLVPTCQRGWARCYGALNAATMDTASSLSG